MSMLRRVVGVRRTLAEDAPEEAEELDRWREALRPLRQALRMAK